MRAVSVIAFLSRTDPDAGAEAALRQHEQALALDPNSVINLWISAVRLGDLGRFDESLRRIARAVELTQQSPLMIAIQARLLMLAGRRDDALALREEIASVSDSRYIGPIVPLLFAVVEGEADGIAAAVRQNIDAGTGATTIAISGVDRELTALLEDARFGPLIRRLSLFAGRDSVARSDA